MAPAASTTSVTARHDELSEDTRNLEVPDITLVIEGVLELVGSEAEALLVGDDRDGRRADLNVRTALATWDLLHEPDEAARLLELAEEHPLALRLRVAIALAGNDAGALAAVGAWVGRAPPSRETAALAFDIADALLWRHRNAARAAAVLDRVLDHARAGELPASWRNHARELAIVAHAGAEAWPRVIALRRADITATSTPGDIAATAALMLDRGGDAPGALALCWDALAHFEPEGAPLGWLRVLDIALDAACALDDDRRLELLERRAELAAAHAGGAIEALATRHAIAWELARHGAHAEATALWLELADEPAATLPGAARRIAQLAAAWTAIAAARPADALTARRALVECESPIIATAHAWRTLELMLAAGTAIATAPALIRAIATHGGPPAALWLDLAERGEPSAATITRAEQRGGLALRTAATIIERGGDLAHATSIWRRAAAEAAPDRLGTELDQLARLARQTAASDDLGDVYATWAGGDDRDDPGLRIAGALWCARGMVDLARGDFVAAEDALQRAEAAGPADPFCRAALAAVYRAGKRWDQLDAQLGELAGKLTSADARAAVAREQADILAEHLGSPEGARAALDRLLADRPDDVAAMIALARLCDREQLWDRAIELYTRAVAHAEPSGRPELWLEIAVREDRRGDPAAALAAVERGAALDPRDPALLHEQARLHRAAGRLDRALVAVRAELAGDPPVVRRTQLQIEQAQLLTALGIEPQAVVAAYLDVLSLEPDHAEALAGIEAPARALELWDELARAFRGAHQTPRNRQVLAEALGHIAEWSELAEVRKRQLDDATEPVERAARAGDLARLYEAELGDRDAAIRMLQLAQDAVPSDAHQRELVRLLRAGERWAELAAALEREQAALPLAEGRHGAELLAELGTLYAEQLGRPDDAIAAYEGVLARRPGDPEATAALERLYETNGRDRELAHLIEIRAEATTDPAERAALFMRVGTLRSERGDLDGGIAALTAAFAADPTNRDVFTALERVCYKGERWAAAMQLYEIAIAHVEAGVSRAYRLGDLYARRGNVQLTFLGQIDAAIASYQKVVEVDSQPGPAIKILEDLAQRRGDWAPLIAAYDRRADAQRDSVRKADALRAAATLAANHAQLPLEAMRLNRKLLAVDPNDAGASAALERYYEDAQDPSGLVDVLKLQLQNTPGAIESVEILRRIARVSEEGARDVDTATEHYLKILELQPDNSDALEALGRIYESTEQWAEFIDVTRRQIKITTDRATKSLLYFRCGSVMEAKFGREHDAIRYYDAAIKTSSTCLPAVHGLRDLYRRREEWPRVIETLELEVKLWENDKERAGVFAQIGRIYEAQLGDPERAMTYYESALTVDPDCLPANQALFEQLFASAQWDKAQPLATALAQKAMRDGDPTTRSEFYRKRGVVARMTGDPRAAAESFIVALEIRPTHAAALGDLGSLAREFPDAWDYDSTYRELEKLYKRRDDAGALLARVQVGRAAIIEREGDLDQAAQLYSTAHELAPADYAVLSALVEFHADMRHWDEAVRALERFLATEGAQPGDRVGALMRQAAIHGDGEMDPARAIAVLREVIRVDPSHQDAYYQLAQQHYLVGRYAEARAAIDRVIELATAPGQPLLPTALARYYYYKGRILDASGDARAAAPQYRRASEYDPGYAPPALVLARRAHESGDQRAAETLLIEAAHTAMAAGGPIAAVPLQRGLARILLASGDRPAAIEAYRGILNVDPDNPADRVALAEIYAVDDPGRAIAELRKLLDRDIHHAPAYRLLASFYNRTGDTVRADRVLTALDLLGFAEETDRIVIQHLRDARVTMLPRRRLDPEHRARWLATPAAADVLGEVFEALADKISERVAAPSLGTNLNSVLNEEDHRIAALVAEVGALFGVAPEVYVGDNVPGLAAVIAIPQQLVVIDRTLLGESDAALRFLFGYAFEAIRGRYAMLLQLGARPRRELTYLLRGLLADGNEVSGIAAELIATATPRVSTVIARHAGRAREVDPANWIDGMLACAKRAGLVACDDFAAAIWMIARLSGENLASHDAAVALGAVLGGPDLVRFFLSDGYQQLRDLLATPVT